MGIVVFVEIATWIEIRYIGRCGMADFVHFGIDAMVEKESCPSDSSEIVEYLAHIHDRIVVRKHCGTERRIGVRSGTPP